MPATIQNPSQHYDIGSNLEAELAWDRKQEQLDKLRKEYVRIYRDLTWERDDMTMQQFTAAVVDAAGHVENLDEVKRAEYLVHVASQMTVPCGRCIDGLFSRVVENGKPRNGAVCFRCNGKGFQTVEDCRRNWGYDQYAFGKAAAAMMRDASPCRDCHQSCSEDCPHYA